MVAPFIYAGKLSLVKNLPMLMKQPRESKDFIFVEADGFSMWPFIKTGERLIVKNIPMVDLKIGDIVLYRSSGVLICHRVINKTETDKTTFLFVRGDNAIGSPERVTCEMLMGKVVGVFKNKRIIKFTSWHWRCTNNFIVYVAPIICRLNKIIKSRSAAFKNSKSSC